MKITCPYCKTELELEYEGVDVLTFCGWCEKFIIVEVRVKNLESKINQVKK